MAKLCAVNFFSKPRCNQHCVSNFVRSASSSPSSEKGSASNDADEFRVLELHKPPLRGRRQGDGRQPKVPEIMPPRSIKMPIDQDWGSVWPTARTFHPASVPLPVRMGYVSKGAAPGKFANAELMKIPNFLHLTPPVVARQCQALKRLCTEWPKSLETEESVRKFFPLEFSSCDYLHSSPSIRDANARIVTLKYKLSDLKLDARAKDKYLRLVGERYDEVTDTVTIVVDRCPSKKQNRDFARYVFSVLYLEATQVEDWESEKTRADLERFIWSGSGSEARTLDIIRRMRSGSETCPAVYSHLPKGEELTANHIAEVGVVRNYADALKSVLEDGETDEILDGYKAAVVDLLGLQRATS